MLRSSSPDRYERRVERFGNPVYHLQTEILVAGFNPVDCALAGPQHVSQLGLGKTPMLAGVPDQAPDPVQVRVRHVTRRYVICEIFVQLIGVSDRFRIQQRGKGRLAALPDMLLELPHGCTL